MEHFDKYFVESTRKITRHLYKGDPREIYIYDSDHGSDPDSCAKSKLKDKEDAANPKKETSGKRGVKSAKPKHSHKKPERVIYNIIKNHHGSRPCMVDSGASFHIVGIFDLTENEKI